MKWPIFAIVFVFLLTVIMPLGLVFGIRYLPGGVQPPLGNTERVYKERTLLQDFISPRNNLVGIGVSIKNPNFANKKAININIYSDQNKIIRKVVLNGQNIADGKFVKIFFDPIDNSLNKKFSWSISSSDSTIEDAIEVFLTDKQPQWSLDLKVNNEIYKQGLSYITLHRPTNSIEVLKEITSDWVYKLNHDKKFLITYLSLLVLCLCLVFISFRKNLFILKEKRTKKV